MKIVLLSIFIGSISLVTQAQSRDSLRLDLEVLFDADKISDTSAFLEGYIEAQQYSRLAIRSVGDPDHVSSCDYYSYQRYGVNLEMTGDIIMDESIFDRNNGFNSAMKQRIQDSIPQWADSVGAVKDNWIEFELQMMRKFYELFDFERESDTLVRVTLIPERIGESIYVSLDGIEISDARTKTTYDFDALVNGGMFKLNGSMGYMKLNVENCSNPNFICFERLVPFRIQEE